MGNPQQGADDRLAAEVLVDKGLSVGVHLRRLFLHRHVDVAGCSITRRRLALSRHLSLGRAPVPAFAPKKQEDEEEQDGDWDKDENEFEKVEEEGEESSEGEESPDTKALGPRKESDTNARDK